MIGIGSGLRDARQVERLGVVPTGMPAAVVHRNRMIARYLVQILARQRHVELGVVEHDGFDPLAGRRLVGARLEIGLQLAHARHIGVDAEQLADAADVAMTIDEAGRDGRAGGINLPGLRGGQIADFCRRSHRDESAVLDGKRFRARPRGIHGDDAGVNDNEIGGDAGPGARNGLRADKRIEARGRKAGGTGQGCAEAHELFAADFLRHGADDNPGAGTRIRIKPIRAAGPGSRLSD